MPLDLCEITGTLYRRLGGEVAAGARLSVRRVVRDGTLLTRAGEPDVIADEDGVVTFELPRDCVAYIYADVEGLHSSHQTGTPLTIPDAASADLEDLLPALNPVSTSVSQAAFNAHVASVLHHADVPDSYAGNALKMLRVNAAATALEFADPDATYATDAALASETAARQAADTTLQTNITAEAAARAAADLLLLPLAGGTLTGALTLAGAPSANLHAATKLYVDSGLAALDLESLTDVDLTNPASGDFLWHNGSQWVNSPLEAADIPALPISKTTGLQAALDGKLTQAAADLLYTALDSDLTAIAALSPSNDDVLQRKAGAWTNRTPAQLKTDLAIAAADVSGLGSLATKSTVATGDITDDAVTFAKLQNIATARMLGRSSSGSGDVEEISIGTGLSLAAGVLSSTVTATPGGSNKQVQFNNSSAFGGATGFEYQSGASPNVQITSQATGHTPLLLQGVASQSVPLLRMNYGTSHTGSILDIYDNSSNLIHRFSALSSGQAVQIGWQQELAFYATAPAGSSNRELMLSGAGHYMKAAHALNWYSGTSVTGSPDSGLARAAAAAMKVTNGSSGFGQLRAASLGVGNSAAATTPGTVTKKIEVFDTSGASLGFVAVYDAIT